MNEGCFVRGLVAETPIIAQLDALSPSIYRGRLFTDAFCEALVDRLENAARKDSTIFQDRGGSELSQDDQPGVRVRDPRLDLRRLVVGSTAVDGVAVIEEELRALLQDGFVAPLHLCEAPEAAPPVPRLELTAAFFVAYRASRGTTMHRVHADRAALTVNVCLSRDGSDFEGSKLYFPDAPLPALLGGGRGGVAVTPNRGVAVLHDGGLLHGASHLLDAPGGGGGDAPDATRFGLVVWYDAEAQGFSRFGALPRALQMDVLSYLSAQTLCRAGCTSKKEAGLAALCGSDLLWGRVFERRIVAPFRKTPAANKAKGDKGSKKEETAPSLIPRSPGGLFNPFGDEPKKPRGMLTAEELAIWDTTTVAPKPPGGGGGGGGGGEKKPASKPPGNIKLSADDPALYAARAAAVFAHRRGEHDDEADAAGLRGMKCLYEATLREDAARNIDYEDRQRLASRMFMKRAADPFEDAAEDRALAESAPARVATLLFERAADPTDRPACAVFRCAHAWARGAAAAAAWAAGPAFDRRRGVWKDHKDNGGGGGGDDGGGGGGGGCGKKAEPAAGGGSLNHEELMARMIRPMETQPRVKKVEPGLACGELPCGIAVADTGDPAVLPAYTRYRKDQRGWAVRYFSPVERTCLRTADGALVPQSSRAALDAVTRAPPLKWRPVKKKYGKQKIFGGRKKAPNRNPPSRVAAPLPTMNLTLTPVKKKT